MVDFALMCVRLIRIKREREREREREGKGRGDHLGGSNVFVVLRLNLA